MQRSSDDPGAGNVLVGLLIEPSTLPRTGATLYMVDQDTLYTDFHNKLVAAGMASPDADLAIFTFKQMVHKAGDLP